MKRLAFAALLPLAACSTFSTAPFQSAMTSLKGQPVQVAFDKLGYPDKEGTVAGHAVYYWGTEESPCSFKIVATEGKIDQWDGYGSPAGCSYYLAKLRG